MNCFSCFTCQRSKKHLDDADPDAQDHHHHHHHLPSSKTPDNGTQCHSPHIQAQAFNFRELAIATRNFRQECLLGEGGFGRVYKGTIPATGKVVAVKQLDRNGMNMGKDFLSEVALLSHLNHDNLVNLIGYCVDGDQRLLVYEYMSRGSLYDRLFGPEEGRSALDWFNRMKIASGAARGLEYLHEKGIVHRDLKSSNILLNDNLNAKLSDVGLNKLFGGDRTNLLSPGGVTGTYGYSAPESTRTGQLTSKSDVYGFGVVLLELITGRRAIDTTRPNEEQNLVSWAQPLFRNPKKFPAMADPVLRRQFPEKDLNQAVAVAAMCLQEEEGARPLMSDVVITLSFLSMEVVRASLPLPAQDDDSSKEEEDEDDDEYEEDDEEDEYYDETEEEEEEIVEGGSSSGCWEEMSMTSSKRSRNLSRKKSSKKGSGRMLSSRKSSRSSYKMSTEWEEGEGEEEEAAPRTSVVTATAEEAEAGEEILLHDDDRGSGRLSQRDISFGLTSSWGSMRSSNYVVDDCDLVISDGGGSPEVARPPRLQHALTTRLLSKDFRRARLTTSSARV